MVKKMGQDNIVGLMGGFSTCMDQTKTEIHSVLDQEIRDLSHMIQLMK